MGRPVPRPKRIDGKIKFMPSDGFFLAARDIVGFIPLRVRIAEVVEYPAGTPRGGFASKEPFTAIMLEVRGTKSGEWKRGSKPWAPNTTALWAIYNRFGEQAEWWVGQEITLDLTPRRNPNGGGIVAGICVVPQEDERTEEQVASKMARALHGQRPTDPHPERVAALHEEAERRIANVNERGTSLVVRSEDVPERQPGEDDEPIDDTTTESDRHV